MAGIPVSDTNLITPSDFSKVRMELFEKTQTGEYKVRYEAALTFLQMAVDNVVDGASDDFNTLNKLQAMIEALQSESGSASGVEFDVTNGTGATIPRGKVVYPNVTTNIGLADAYVKAKSRVIAIVKDDIAVGEDGKVVKLGVIENIDTSAFVAGQVAYLDRDGNIVPTTPIDGGFICIVGIVDVVSASAGKISVDTHVSPTTVEITDNNGFPAEQRAATTLVFDDATRTLTIAPTGSSFHYYQMGDKFEQTSPQSIVIADIAKDHVVYFDGETLTSISNSTDEQIGDIIMNKAIVALIYWNAAESKAIIVQDERHGMMQPVVHAYLHVRFGAFHVSGLAVEDITIGNGSSDAHAQFGSALGKVQDEDIVHDLQAVASTLGLDIVFRTGTAGIFNKTTNAGFSFTTGANSRPNYNLFNGTTWSTEEVPSGDFFNIHIFACGSISHKPIALTGTAIYNNSSNASAGQADELTTILGTLPLPEFVLIASIIIQVRDNFSNSVNAAIVRNTDGHDYTDWTKTELAAGTPPSSHELLAGLKDAADGVQWGHVNSDLYARIMATTPSIIANKGVGTDAAKPVTGLTIGDIYVSNDTYKIYTAVSTTTWDDGVDLGSGQFVTSGLTYAIYQYDGNYLKAISNQYISFALSDETTDLTTDNDTEIEIIQACDIQSIVFAVNTAPTGSSILVTISKNGTSIQSITLTASSKTVTVSNTTSLAVGDRIKADITQIGATIAGAGAKVYIKTKLT